MKEDRSPKLKESVAPESDWANHKALKTQCETILCFKVFGEMLKQNICTEAYLLLRTESTHAEIELRL